MPKAVLQPLRSPRQNQAARRPAVELAERAQHREPIVNIVRDGVTRRQHIHEGLVHHQQPTLGLKMPAKREEFIACNQPPVRIVGIDDDRQIRRKKIRHLLRLADGKAGEPRHLRMFGIGGRQDSRSLSLGRKTAEARLDQQGQKDLRAGRRRNMIGRSRAINLGRNVLQPHQIIRLRQAGKGFRRKKRNWIGVRIDAGGEVNPWPRRCRKQAFRPSQVAAMLDSVHDRRHLPLLSLAGSVHGLLSRLPRARY